MIPLENDSHGSIFIALKALPIAPIPALDESADEVVRQFYREVVRVSLNVSISWAGPPIGITEGLFVAVAPALFTALGAWLGSRNGRKVRIKVGDIEVEAQTQEQVEILLACALEIQGRNRPAKIVP